MQLRTGLLLTVAGLSLVATPALARDGSPYVGVEAGILKVRDGNYEYQGTDGLFDSDLDVDHKLGIDADIIAGYDFGLLRAEAELGWKRARIDDVEITNDALGTFAGDGGKARTVSAMGNLLLDFGNEDSAAFYVGGGAGVARTRYKIDALSFGATDSNFAWQLIAGARMPVSENLDLGVKYRYFRTKFNVEETDTEEVLGKWRSHSLLASLIYNFGAPAVAPPPPPPPAPEPVAPPPPATQTCPDGSVILATDSCPVPPPPPPPPPPAPERG